MSVKGKLEDAHGFVVFPVPVRWPEFDWRMKPSDVLGFEVLLEVGGLGVGV